MKETRKEQVKRWVLDWAPDLRVIFTLTDAVTFHQDQVARDLTNDELVILGSLIKVAGMYGVEITFAGKCGERAKHYAKHYAKHQVKHHSGENPKDGTPNKG